MRNHFLEFLLIVVPTIGILAIFASLVGGFLAGRREYNHFMNDCMAGGHKESECRILLSYKDVK